MDERDKARQAKIEESASFLIDAAMATAEAAQAITSQLKKKLEDSVNKFETTSRILNDSLILCDMNGTIQHANPAACNEFGCDLNGKSIIGLFDGVDETTSISDLFELLADQNNWKPGTNRAMRARNSTTGDTFLIEPKLERLDWHNKTSSMLMLIRVSTRQSQFPETLPVLENSFNGILIVQNHLIVAANPVIKRIFGYESTELLDQPLSTLFPLAEHHRLNGIDDTAQVYITGSHENGSFISLIVTSTGIVWNDQPATIVTVREFSDATRIAELAAFKRENNPDVIVCFNPDYEITFANNAFAAMYHRTRQELIHCHLQDIVPEREFEILDNHRNAITRETASSRYQVQHDPTGAGEPKLYDWVWQVVFDAEGNPVEYQRTGRDISDVVSNLSNMGYF